MKALIELGWLKALNLLVSGTNNIISGVSVSSSCSLRRSASVGFNAYVPQSTVDSGQVTVNQLQQGASQSSLTNGIASVQSQDSATYGSISAPSVASVTTASVTQVQPTGGSSSSSDDNTAVIVGATVGGVAAVALIIVVVIIIVKKSGAEAAGGTAMEMAPGVGVTEGKPTDALINQQGPAISTDPPHRPTRMPPV